MGRALRSITEAIVVGPEISVYVITVHISNIIPIFLCSRQWQSLAALLLPHQRNATSLKKTNELTFSLAPVRYTR